MASDWKEVTLGELVDFSPKRTIKKGIVAPFLSMADITENTKFITEIFEKKYTGGGSRFKNGDTLFARIIPCLQNGKCSKVTGIDEDKIGHGSTEFIVMAAKYPSYDEDFIYYLARSTHFRAYAESRMVGSTGRQRVSWQDLAEYETLVPEKTQRKVIGYFLSILDDKIELNRQINDTLEAMAQALFKSWFVDFDPVIDNALNAGKPIPDALKDRAERRRAVCERLDKTTNAEINALFPDEFEFDEDMGWIPKGWRVSKVGKQFEVTMGQSPPGSSYNDTKEGIVFFQGSTDFKFRFPENRIYTTQPKRMAYKGDTLVSVRAPVGAINMAMQDCCIGRGLSAVRHKTHKESFTYYSMLHLREILNRFEAEGTVFGSINQKDFKSLPQLKVPNEVIVKFESFVKCMDEKIELNSAQNQTLAKLRDTLLPKLLSGELSVAELAHIIDNI